MATRGTGYDFLFKILVAGDGKVRFVLSYKPEIFKIFGLISCLLGRKDLLVEQLPR